MASHDINLRGSCQCGRNQYAVQIPSASTNLAQILFDSNTNHRIASASPLSAFLRIPLTWYHSQVFPFFDDEVRSTIRRSYAQPNERHAQRSFCGYCGTPLSYWSEQPPSEAEYIQLTLGSLLTEDIHSLQELGFLPDEDEEEEVMELMPAITRAPRRGLAGRDITGIPWFENLISGSRLGAMCGPHNPGRVRIEVEVTEWTMDDDQSGEDRERDGSESSSSTTGKRKRGLDKCK